MKVEDITTYEEFEELAPGFVDEGYNFLSFFGDLDYIDRNTLSLKSCNQCMLGQRYHSRPDVKPVEGGLLDNGYIREQELLGLIDEECVELGFNVPEGLSPYVYEGGTHYKLRSPKGEIDDETKAWTLLDKLWDEKLAACQAVPEEMEVDWDALKDTLEVTV